MIRRSLSVGLAILAVGLMVAVARADDTPPPAKAKPNHGLGKFVSYDKDAKKLVVSHKKGGEKTLELADKVTVTIEDSPGKLEDLVQGDRVSYKFGDDGKVVEVHKLKKVPRRSGHSGSGSSPDAAHEAGQRVSAPLRRLTSAGLRARENTGRARPHPTADASK